MTPEEIEAKRVADEQAIADEMAKSELVQLQEKLAKAEEDRDNYKKVALTRKGKLPGDADFFKDEGELSVAEQVRIALLERDVEKVREAEKAENARLLRENSELRLAAKNRPGSSVSGGDGGSSVETKDNTFSEAQLAVLRKTAERLKADPEKFIQKAKENLSRRS